MTCPIRIANITTTVSFNALLGVTTLELPYKIWSQNVMGDGQTDELNRQTDGWMTPLVAIMCLQDSCHA